MGFRFRKSVNIGPVQFTASKSGISSSVGGRGFRVTKTANGKTRTTTSIPGTGISYTSESRHRATSSRTMTHHYVPDGQPMPNGPGKKPSKHIFAWILSVFFLISFVAYFTHIAGWIMLLIGLLLLPVRPLQNLIGRYLKPWMRNLIAAGLFILCLILVPSGESGNQQALPAETTAPTTEATVEAVQTELPEEAAAPTQEQAVKASADDAAETAAPAETAEPAAVAAEAEATEVQSTDPLFTESTVEDIGQDYVLNTSSRKFHLTSCSSVAKIKPGNRKDFFGSREDLIDQGYSPCGRCHP